MNQRADGWYWVKLEDSDGWIPWEWRSSSRSPQGTWFNSETPIEVGQRVPTPDEPWQCVPKEPTEDMMHAGCVATGDCERIGECHLDCHFSPAPKVYRAMLSAAPTPGENRHEDAEG